MDIVLTETFLQYTTTAFVFCYICTVVCYFIQKELHGKNLKRHQNLLTELINIGELYHSCLVEIGIDIYKCHIAIENMIKLYNTAKVVAKSDKFVTT